MQQAAVLNLTRIMEHLIDEHDDTLTIMRELLRIATEAHRREKVGRFTIGDSTYTLDELVRIQAIEEHEAFVARHRPSGP